MFMQLVVVLFGGLHFCLQFVWQFVVEVLNIIGSELGATNQ